MRRAEEKQRWTMRAASSKRRHRRRRLIGTAVTFALAMALTSGNASAGQVYDYIYSGTYTDGSTSTGGAFPSGVGGVAFNDLTEGLLVIVGGAGQPARVTQFTPGGVPDPFTAPEFTDTVELPLTFLAAQVAVDESAGPDSGSIYATHQQGEGGGGGRIVKLRPDGTEVAGYDGKLDSFLRGAICGLDIDQDGNPWVASSLLRQLTLGGEETDVDVQPYRYFKKGEEKVLFSPCGLTFDNNGDVYARRASTSPNASGRPVKLKASSGEEQYELNQINARTFAVDPSNNDVFVLQTDDRVRQYDDEGALLEVFGEEEASTSFAGLAGGSRGIAVDPNTHDVWITNRRDAGAGVRRLEKFERSAPITVPTTRPVDPTYSGTSATLRGIVNPDGIETTNCHFEWGSTPSFGTSVPCVEGNSHSGSSDIPVSAAIGTLTKGNVYYYRLSSENANGRASLSGPQRFIAQESPAVGQTFVDQVNTDSARLRTPVSPNGGDTVVRFEW